MMRQQVVEPIRVYSVYWTGTLLMQVSTQIFMVIFAWSLTSEDSSSDMSFLVYVASNVPFVVLTFFSAYLCRLMIIRWVHALGQLGILLGIVGFWIFLSTDNLFLGLLALLIWNVGIAIRGPAYHAMINELFEGDARVAAFSYHDFAVNIARLSGPFIGSFLIAGNRMRIAIVVSILSVVVSLFAVFALDLSKTKASVLKQTRPQIEKRYFYLFGVFATAFSLVAGQALLPSLTRSVFGDVIYLATFTASFGLGAICGSLIQRRVAYILGRNELAVLFLLCVQKLILLCLVQDAVAISVSLFFGGLGSVILYLRLKTSYLSVGSSSQGPGLLASYFMSTYCGFSLGALIWGNLAHILTPQGAIGLATASLFLSYFYVSRVYHNSSDH